MRMTARIAARVGPRRPSGALVRLFAVRSGLLVLVAAAVLHTVVARAVNEHFFRDAEFHAMFVTEALLQPQLTGAVMAMTADEETAAKVSWELRERVVDENVYQVTVWTTDGTVVVADDPMLIGTSAAEDPTFLEVLRRSAPSSVVGESPFVSVVPPSASTLRTYVPFGVDVPLVAEIHQDWAPVLAASRGLTRNLDYGLLALLATLWVLLLPIAGQAGRRIHERARIDELTGLPNHLAAVEHLRHALPRLERTPGSIVVLSVDIDGFKSVNDAHGRAAGDKVIKEIAERVGQRLRASDVMARVSADEFVIVLEDADVVMGDQVAQRVQSAVGDPLKAINGQRLTASIGLDVTSTFTSDPDELLRNANAAMTHIKGMGGNGCRVFDEELAAEVARRHWIERDLPFAAFRGELELHYQPFIGLSGEQQGRVVAIEALVRWAHGEHGYVSPGEFIPLAEHNGTIRDLGSWILRRVCEQAATWAADLAADRPFVAYMNLSPAQMTPDFLTLLDECLNETGLDPTRLGFEITETALVDDNAVMITVLDGIRERGCRVAIDDFGTGYSSLSRLRELPLDLLKLDASFVQCVTDGSRELAIVTAVSSMATELGIDVLAEGIETAEQLSAMTSLGFDYGQGYFLSRPASSLEVQSWLRTDRRIQAGLPS